MKDTKTFLISIALGAMLFFTGCNTTNNNNYYNLTEVIVDINNVSGQDIENYHYNGNEVSCKIPVATYNPDYYDSFSFDGYDIGNVVEYDTNLRWVDISTYSIYYLMAERIDVAYQMNCDNVIFEDIDIWYYNDGFGISEEIAYQYYSDLVNEVRNRGMQVGAFELDFEINNDIYYLFDFIVQ